MSTPVVELTDAVAVLGSFPALAGATIRVDRGEIVLLRGPNGAGKTTLLRLCAGLVPIVRGTGRILGFDLSTDREEIRRHVGVLGHQNGLYLRPQCRREHPVLGSDGRGDERRDASGDGAVGCRRPVGRRAGPQAVGRPEAPHRAGLPGRPSGPALAARRTTCRPRRRRPGRTRRDTPSGGTRRAPPSWWPATSSNGPGRWQREPSTSSPGTSTPRSPGSPTRERVARRPPRRRARTCASSGTAGCSPIRSCRSPA